MTKQHRIVSLVLLSLGACAPKLTYPPDQATLDACSHDCREERRTCQGQGCDADQSTCLHHCRDYGGFRGGSHGVTVELPSPKK